MDELFYIGLAVLNILWRESRRPSMIIAKSRVSTKQMGVDKPISAMSFSYAKYFLLVFFGELRETVTLILRFIWGLSLALMF